MQETRLFEYYNDNRTFHLSHMIRKDFYDQRKSHHHEKMYEIYYLLSGERNYFIEDRVLIARKGDLVIINKKEMHHTADRSVPGHERLLLNFSDAFVRLAREYEEMPLLPFSCGSGVLRLSREEQSAVEHLLFKMMEELKGKPTGFELYVGALLTELLLLIHRWGGQQGNQESSSEDSVHGKITLIARYLAANYKEDITLARLSEQFFISPYYLCRIFKKLTGISVVNYIQIVRVREAQRLLAETEKKIIHIAEMVGYSSVGHFNRIFKKIALIPPLKYRKRVRQN
jgi:AraC-like DNA-binding protein